MREELVRRHYAQTTIRTYLMAMEEFRRCARKRLDHMGLLDYGVPAFTEDVESSNYPVFKGPATL
jgi:hypothetical protein